MLSKLQILLYIQHRVMRALVFKVKSREQKLFGKLYRLVSVCSKVYRTETIFRYSLVLYSFLTNVYI